MPYTTEVAVENYLATDINNSFSGQITEWLMAVDSYINNYCNRPEGFGATTGARYYDGYGGREIVIDAFTNITAVEILEQDGSAVNQTLDASDYWKYPSNSSVQYKLVLTPDSSLGRWPNRSKSVRVTGDFGYGTSVPYDIKLAATMLMAKIIEKGLKGGNITSESLGDYSVTYENIAEADKEIGATKILDRYKIWTL